MDEYLRANRAHWDELAALHFRSPYYDVEGFRAGRISLMSLEREELGDVAGKSLLHLQCHFGLDTLSWARLGARVTGVDFSPQAIALARALSEELSIPARFVHSDLYALPQALSGRFDIVFTSYGVLCWLHDLPRWAQVVAHFLEPGGVFYIAEIHPCAGIFYDEADATDLRVFYPYFGTPEPLRWEEDTSYGSDEPLQQRATYEWPHGLGEIVSALTAAGLYIDFLHEFPWCCYRMLPFLEEDEEGRWWLPGRATSVPMTFSLKAKKSAD